MEAVKSPAEQRVVLRNISWETYERLLAERKEDRAPRFTYDRGVLEIKSPSTGHEAVSRIVALLVQLLAVETGLDLFSAGSTTFKREDLERGFEPDECFYLRDVERVRGNTDIDLAVDPPPDLVVEVDITNLSLDKLPTYARIGIPEVWRYDGERLRILALRDEKYEESAESTVLPLPVTGAVLGHFVEEGLSSEFPTWVGRVREWARESSG